MIFFLVEQIVHYVKLFEFNLVLSFCSDFSDALVISDMDQISCSSNLWDHFLTCANDVARFAD